MKRDANEILAAFDAYMASEQYVKDAEYIREVIAAENSFEAYWAGSASASVMRDYKAGRVVTIKA